MRGAVAVVGGVSEPRAACRLDRARALHRSRIDEQNVIAKAGAVGGEDAHEPLDRVRQAPPALVKTRLLGQPWKQVAKALAGDAQKAPVRRDPHDCLGHTERDQLRVSDPAAGISRLLRQEIVRRAINGDAESVELGEGPVRHGPTGADGLALLRVRQSAGP